MRKHSNRPKRPADPGLLAQVTAEQGTRGFLARSTHLTYEMILQIYRPAEYEAKQAPERGFPTLGIQSVSPDHQTRNGPKILRDPPLGPHWNPFWKPSRRPNPAVLALVYSFQKTADKVFRYDIS